MTIESEIENLRSLVAAFHSKPDRRTQKAVRRFHTQTRRQFELQDALCEALDNLRKYNRVARYHMRELAAEDARQRSRQRQLT